MIKNNFLAADDRMQMLKFQNCRQNLPTAQYSPYRKPSFTISMAFLTTQFTYGWFIAKKSSILSLPRYLQQLSLVWTWFHKDSRITASNSHAPSSGLFVTSVSPTTERLWWCGLQFFVIAVRCAGALSFISCKRFTRVCLLFTFLNDFVEYN